MTMMKPAQPDERRRDLARRHRFEETRRAIAERLRRVCRDWPQREFDQLSRKVALTQLRYERWAGLPEPLRIQRSS